MPEEIMEGPGDGQSSQESSPGYRGQEQTSEPFFSYKGDDGKETVYKTKDELSKAYKDSMFMRKDYTQKTQSLAEERKKWETEKEQHFRWYDQTQRQAEEYKKYDAFLKSRPDVFRQLQKAMQQGASPDAVQEVLEQKMDEKYGKEINEMKTWRAEQEARSRRDQTFSAMKEKFEDFDEEAVSQALSELASGDLSTLVEQIYYANKGRMSPMQIEKKIVNNLQKKQSARMVGGSNNAKGSSGGFKNLRAAKEAAMLET